MDQRSSEWFEERRGKFTASSIHDLLSNGKAAGSFGKPFFDLCFKKACEIVFGLDPSWDVVSYDMQRGINWEPDAFQLFRWNKMLDFVDVETCGFIPYGNAAGASPDGLVSDGGNLEIKCPKPPKLFTIIKDGKDAIDAEYIAQMQMQMLATDRDFSYFFNYTVWQDRPMWHEIIVEADKSIQNKIIDRLGEGVIQRDKYVEILRNNKQF